MQIIIDQISGISPLDPIEKSHQDDTLKWIKSGSQIFRIEKPDYPKKHLVSYSVLVDPLNSKILLVDHKNAELWLPCGGHVEQNENPRVAARRELDEELGIMPKLLFENPIFVTQTMTVGHTAGHTDVSLWYVFLGASDASFDFDEKEFNSVKWFSFHEIPFEKADPHMKRFMSKLTNVIEQSSHLNN